MPTKILRAYHGKPAVKAKYLKRIRLHAAADEIVQGAYWQDGKGCAVGCVLHDPDGGHEKYETLLGIPVMLAHMEDRIFEGLANGTAKAWPERFLKAIRVNADLSRVGPRFLLAVQERRRAALTNPEQYGLGAAMDQVIAILRTWAETGSVDASAAESAESAAWSAASAAWSAAWSAESAAWSAESAAWSAASAAWSAASAAESAESAAESAESAAESAASAASAAESAESAAWSAESAAWSAESAEYDWMADTLVALLESAPVKKARTRAA